MANTPSRRGTTVMLECDIDFNSTPTLAVKLQPKIREAVYSGHLCATAKQAVVDGNSEKEATTLQ